MYHLKNRFIYIVICMDKKSRIAIQQDTIVKLQTDKSLQYATTFTKIERAKPTYSSKFTTSIKVINGDTLDTTLALQEELDETVCFLIMGNPTNPGGGFLQGSRAQEESTCRRTNLVVAHDKVKYPLPEFGGVYCDDLQVIKDSLGNSYKKPVSVDAIMCYAYRYPPMEGDKLDPKYTDLTTKKIQGMFDIVLKKGVVNLVLSAFGCGAFGNPPQHMAEMFKATLNSRRYRGCFRTVIFAIKDYNGTKNLPVFQKEFAS